MAKILYAVCGEGMGHAIRSVVIIKYLLKKGHKLQIFSSNRAYFYLNQRFKNVHKIHGMTIVYEDNTVRNRKTVFHNIKTALPKALPKSLKKMYKMAKKFKPDLIISDFELYSNYIAKVFNIPMVSIDNQHIFTKTKIKYPRKKYLQYAINAKAVVNYFIQGAKCYFITTFFYPTIKKSIRKNVFLFPPILRDEILKKKPTIGEHILVYQTSKSYTDLFDILKSVDEKFIVYGFDKNEKKDNVQMRKFSEKQFIDDMASAKAVIVNGGFTTISEALYFGKPVLCIPVRKQFEQILNAIYIKKLGYGDMCEFLTKKILLKFISKLDEYRYRLYNYCREDNSKIFEKFDEVIRRLNNK